MTYLDDVDARAKAATRSPWDQGKQSPQAVWYMNQQVCLCWDRGDENAAFISHARQDVPILVERLRACLKLLKEKLPDDPDAVSLLEGFSGDT